MANANMKRRRLRATKAASDVIAGFFHADPAKALVMTYMGQMVADGHAEWDMRENGDIELSFNTGETYLLAERTIIRLT